MRLREQLAESLREQVLEHRDLEVKEIADLPEIRERLEVLWPMPVAATQFYRHQIRKFIASDLSADGTRTYVSVEQPSLVEGVNETAAPATVSRSSPMKRSCAPIFPASTNSSTGSYAGRSFRLPSRRN